MGRVAKKDRRGQEEKDKVRETKKVKENQGRTESRLE